MYRIEAVDRDGYTVHSFDTNFWVSAKIAQLWMRVIVWWYQQPITVYVFK